MNTLVLHIWIALILDFLIGDPRWLPHPVCLIGRTAEILEKPARQIFCNQRLAGIIVAVTIITGTGFITWGLLITAYSLSPLTGDLFEIWILYTTFAVKDLAVHSNAVFQELETGNLPEARHLVSRMVGRDTEQLNEQGIVRAAVESVAENSVDGILAPLFYAVLFGPIGAMVYKAINTLDSTFGYKNDRYLQFGTASARIDDIANYIPARLSLLFITIGAALSGNQAKQAFCTGLRDAQKHISPNAGYSEAAFAGALGIQIGGQIIRNGQLSSTPKLGDPVNPLERRHIRKTNRLMFAVTIVAVLFMTGIRILLEGMII